jgi:hypothetical protein
MGVATHAKHGFGGGSMGVEGVDGVPTHAKQGFGGGRWGGNPCQARVRRGSMGCRPMPSRGSEGVRWGGEAFEDGSGAAVSTEGRVEGTRLPAGLSLTSCLPGLCFTSCLPGLCFTSCLPGLCFTSCLPGLCFTSSPPGSFLQRPRPPAYRAPPARPAATRNQARQTRALLPSGTSYRSEKNPPLTHGDPAEAGPPGQSQPSRVHPVKQQAGAMRTRTGTQPPSTSRATPVPRICAHLRTDPGGGRHPQTRPTSPPPCDIPWEKPPKWRTATPQRIPPLPPPACSPARRFHAFRSSQGMPGPTCEPYLRAQ